jgi:hypothetical protein
MEKTINLIRRLCLKKRFFMTNPASFVETISHNLFETLAQAFPIACASDEFFYFPQVRLSEPKWEIWDCFSEEMVRKIVRRLSTWEDELGQVPSYPSDPELQVDISLLQKVSHTLREQLSEVRIWESQPTFYLTLVCIGLAEAMESEDPAAKHERARGLPAFLDQAGHNLDHVPVLFRDLGLEMVPDTKNYIVSLRKIVPELQPALSALDRFEDAIRNVSTRKDFLIPRDLLERIIRFHIHCDMDIREANHKLDQEIDDMQRILDEKARGLVPNLFTCQSAHEARLEALKHIPIPTLGEKGMIRIYEDAVNGLANHCLDKGLVSPALFYSCPVCVAPVPSFLSAIRSASSYSIPPKHPPSGGTFFIMNPHITDKTQHEPLREYRMLSAHETYPGHHLLDTSRWSLARTCRRVVEQPIFYEGWACFAEELMQLTGYFSGPGDRFLLAKRRLWRAIRGKLAISLQTGKMDIPTAAGYLKETGISMDRALSLVRKYPLNPGYRLCYTIGLQRFLDFFEKYGRDSIQNFVHTILAQGEINFTDLENILKNNNN